MTANQFAAECTARLIPPALALENENVRRYLAEKQDEKVIETLEEEF